MIVCGNHKETAQTSKNRYLSILWLLFGIFNCFYLLFRVFFFSCDRSRRGHKYIRINQLEFMKWTFTRYICAKGIFKRLSNTTFYSPHQASDWKKKWRMIFRIFFTWTTFWTINKLYKLPAVWTLDDTAVYMHTQIQISNIFGHFSDVTCNSNLPISSKFISIEEHQSIYHQLVRVKTRQM